MKQTLNLETTDYSLERILLLRRILNWIIEENNPSIEQAEIEQFAEMSNWEIQHLFSQYFQMDLTRFLHLINKRSFGNHAFQQLSIFDVPEMESNKSESPAFQFEVELVSQKKHDSCDLILYSIVQTVLGDIFVASINEMVCQCTFESTENGLARLKKSYPKSELIQDRQEIHHKIAQLINNENQSNSIQLFVKGTPFQIKVWQVLTQIPSGKTTTYGEIAQQLGDPNLARAVGTAVGANPVAILIPCHRVIAQTGTIGKFRWGTDLKRILLAVEH